MLTRRRPFVAAFACLAFVTGLALPIFQPHDATLDVDTGWGERPLVVHVNTQFERAQDSAADEHCALCHWSRLVSSAVTSTPSHPVGYSLSPSARPPAVRGVASGATDQTAPRGPPILA